MNRKIATALALAAAFAAGATFEPMAAQSQSAKRFELECEEQSGALINVRNLNKLMQERAAAGWDLVGAAQLARVYCFRRPAP